MSAGAVFATDLWSVARAQSAQPGEGPYGPLQPPDANGIRLPEGFTSSVVARSIEPVGDSGFEWPAFPDGAATFPAEDGGWYPALAQRNARQYGEHQVACSRCYI